MSSFFAGGVESVSAKEACEIIALAEHNRTQTEIAAAAVKLQRFLESNDGKARCASLAETNLIVPLYVDSDTWIFISASGLEWHSQEQKRPERYFFEEVIRKALNPDFGWLTAPHNIEFYVRMQIINIGKVTQQLRLSA